MAFPFSGLYETIPDIDLYLERIDYHGDRTPTLENLQTLIQKNQTHIPYGNLDFYPDPHCPSLAIPDIFEKLIVRRGCGGCFELNLLFFELLRSLGYELFPVTVRCLFGASEPVVPTHCGAIVTIDGKQYYVDVGLGNSSAVVPVALDDETHWQPELITSYRYSYKVHRDGNTFWFEGTNGIEQMTMVSFQLEPVDVIDFIPLNYYASQAETSPVRRGVIVMIFTENGRAQIVKNRLSILTEDTDYEKTIETADDFNHVLQDTFGIDYQVDPQGFIL